MKILELVSVIIPTFKRPGMLGRAINSVLNQTHTNVEVIVVDDNSSGDSFRRETELFMNKYRFDTRVIYLKHEINKNGSAARNTGIRYSTGKYICFLDDDDFFLPDKIEKQLQLFMKDDSIDACCSNFVTKYKKSIYKVETNQGVYDTAQEFMSFKLNFAAGSTLMVKKSVLIDMGGFDVTFNRHQDWEFLIRFFRKYRLGIVEHIGVVICVEGFRNRPNTQLLIDSKFKLYSEFKDDYEALTKYQKNEIKVAQCLEIIDSFAKNRDYRGGISFMKNNNCFVKRRKVYSSYCFNTIISISPLIMNVLYFLFAIIIYLKNRHLYKSILACDKLNSMFQ